jgi:hypothetical protein
VKDAVAKIHETIEQIEQNDPNAAVIALGDLNSATIRLKRYKQHVNIPTRKNKTLDKCYTQNKYTYNAYKLPAIGASDHTSVLLLPHNHRADNTNKPKYIHKRLWSNENILKLQNCLDMTDWSAIINCATDTIDSATTAFNSYLTYCIDECVPLIQMKNRNDKPWINPTIRKLLQLRCTALRNRDYTQLKHIRTKLQREIRLAKRQQARATESKFNNDPKSAWSELHKLLKTKSSKKECSVSVCALNDFYCRFERTVSTPILPNVASDFLPFTFVHVYNALKSVDTNKSTGPDNIGGRVLKTLADSLAQPICDLFNLSISSGNVPRIWKTSSIVPIPKSSGASEPKDYRPIALTPILAKCLERLISPMISDKLDDCYQFAYRRNRSTDDALIVLLDKVTNHLDQNAQNYTRAVFLDFSSAFNTLDASLMIEKLLAKGVHDNIINWIWNFLTERTQVVITKEGKSPPATTSTGSPQGCVLSPILFTLYVEDMRTTLPNMDILKYADDTIIMEHICKGEASNLQSELQQIVAWCDSNHLVINTGKTKEMLFTNARHEPCPPDIYIHGQALERVDEYKYLGTTVTSKLKFQNNTNIIVNKVRKRQYMMRTLAKIGVSHKTIKLVYEAFIESVLSYHLAVLYKHLTASETRDLNNLIRTSYKLSGNKLVHKSLDDLYESRLKLKCIKLLVDSNPILDLNTYPSGRYIIPKHRINARKQCFRYQAVLYLNKFLKF